MKGKLGIQKKYGRLPVMLTCSAVACLAGNGVAQVNIPDGFEIVRFGYTENQCALPQINNCGEIVYQERMGPSTADWEIMLYDNGRLRQVTDNHDWDAVPRINDHGTMLLIRGIGDEAPTRIVLLENGQETLFEEHQGGYASIALNNAGQIAFSRQYSLDCPIRSASFLWDGRKAVQISPDELFDQSESLNEFGQVAYMHTDFCVNPWAGDIRLFVSKRETLTLPTVETQLQEPSLNVLGQVVWRAPTGIEFWNGARTVLLADRGSVPSINNLGDVYFNRGGEIQYSTQPWIYRVSGGTPTFHRLAQDGARHGRGDVNDWGEVAWIWREQLGLVPSEIWYMRRVRTGEADFDGVIELDDHATFAGCLTGPARVERLCDCRFLDMDNDGDVDLGDFARFQNAFGSHP